MSGVVQTAVADPGGSPSSASVAYAAAQTAGNQNLLFVGVANSSGSGAVAVTAIGDSVGNAYTLVGSFFNGTAGNTCQVFAYLCTSIAHAAAGANTASVTISPNGTYFELYIVEVNGFSSLDTFATTGGTSGTSLSGSITTSAASEFLVDYTFTANEVNSGSGNWTQDSKSITSYGALLQYEAAGAAGPYTSSCTQPSSGNNAWAQIIVALGSGKAALPSIGSLDPSPLARGRQRMGAGASNPPFVGSSLGWAPAKFQTWVPDPGRPAPTSRGRPHVSEPFDALAGGASPHDFLGWTNDSTVAMRSRAQPELPYTGSSLGWAPTDFQTWAPDSGRPRVSHGHRSASVDALDALALAPSLEGFIGWTTEPGRTAAPRPPVEPPFVGASLGWAPVEFQAWASDVVSHQARRADAADPHLGDALVVVALAEFVEWAPSSPARRVTVDCRDEAWTFRELALTLSGFAEWATPAASGRARAAIEPSDAWALPSSGASPFLDWSPESVGRPARLPHPNDAQEPWRALQPPPSAFLEWTDSDRPWRPHQTLVADPQTHQALPVVVLPSLGWLDPSPPVRGYWRLPPFDPDAIASVTSRKVVVSPAPVRLVQAMAPITTLSPREAPITSLQTREAPITSLEASEEPL